MGLQRYVLVLFKWKLLDFWISRHLKCKIFICQAKYLSCKIRILCAQLGLCLILWRVNKLCMVIKFLIYPVLDWGKSWDLSDLWKMKTLHRCIGVTEYKFMCLLHRMKPSKLKHQSLEQRRVTAGRSKGKLIGIYSKNPPVTISQASALKFCNSTILWCLW